MKKIISFVVIGLVLSGCTLFRTHKIDIDQGNIITQEDVSSLHYGMTETQVKEIMGTPILVNIFTPNRIDYVYSFQEGYGQMKVRQVTCIFQNERLKVIEKN